MTTIALTQANFADVIKSHDIVLVDFWAAWCGPCRAFGPIFDAASDTHPDIAFAKVDTEAEPQLAAMFGISSIPTVVAFREKVMVYGEAGALPAPELEKLIGTLRELDMEDVHAQVAATKTNSAAAPAS